MYNETCETCDTPERKGAKMEIINSSLTFLVVGTILVAFYIHHEGLKRPTTAVKPEPESEPEKDSKQDLELASEAQL